MTSGRQSFRLIFQRLPLFTAELLSFLSFFLRHLLPPFFFFPYFCFYFCDGVLLPTVPASRRCSFVATATRSRWRVSRQDWALNVVWSQHSHTHTCVYIYRMRTDWDTGSVHSVQHSHPTQMLVDVHFAHCTHTCTHTHTHTHTLCSTV